MNVNKINLYLIRFSLSALLIFVDNNLYNIFWQLSRILFILIMFSRPLSDLFTEYKILKKIVLIRQWLWVICWNYAIAHVVWYFLNYGINPFETIFDFYSWNPTNRYWSWMLAFIFIIIPRITSNRKSMNLLSKNWKKIQYFAYPAFFLTWIHIALIMWKIEPYITLSAYIIIYFLAYISKKWITKKILHS